MIDKDRLKHIAEQLGKELGTSFSEKKDGPMPGYYSSDEIVAVVHRDNIDFEKRLVAKSISSFMEKDGKIIVNDSVSFDKTLTSRIADSLRKDSVMVDPKGMNPLVFAVYDNIRVIIAPIISY